MGAERENSELANSTEGSGRNWRIMLPGKRMSEIIRASAVTTTSYVPSEMVDVWKSTRVYIYATITTGSAGGIVSLVPEVSGGKTTAEADFFPLFAFEDIGQVDLPSSPSSSYIGTNFNSKIVKPQEFRNEASDADDDVIKIGFFVDVLGARKLRVKARSLAGTPILELQAFKVANG